MHALWLSQSGGDSPASWVVVQVTAGEEWVAGLEAELAVVAEVMALAVGAVGAVAAVAAGLRQPVVGRMPTLLFGGHGR